MQQEQQVPIYVVGKVYAGKRNDIRIYVYAKYRKKLENLIGKKVEVVIFGTIS
jgi:hypothetical protein